MTFEKDTEKKGFCQPNWGIKGEKGTLQFDRLKYNDTKQKRKTIRQLKKSIKIFTNLNFNNRVETKSITKLLNI